MSDPSNAILGHIVWCDLTVPNADAVRDFYAQVTGWTPVPLSMGSYNDYCMNSPQDGKTVAGICHARGSNAALPPQWLVYIRVANVDVSAQQAIDAGGAVLDGPRDMGGNRFCVIRDPAGAVAALIS